MASNPRPLSWAAWVTAAALALLVLGTALALALHADHFSLRRAEWSALLFTLKQATLSALIATLLAIPTARALARRRFAGHGAIIALMGAPFLLPIVVAVIAVLSVFGRSGIVNQILNALGFPPFSIFGLHGVVMTNVFFDLPLATRILLNGWASIPAERFRLAQSLNLPPAAQFRIIEAPMLREMVPGAFLLVFLLCLTSFVVSLTLGGGPGATTLELAIYQALRFDFDLGRASLLAALQFATCGLAVLLAGRFALPSQLGTGLDRLPQVPAPSGWRLPLDLSLVFLVCIYLALPLLVVIKDGLPLFLHLPSEVWRAALRSTLMASASALLATLGGLAIALSVARRDRAAPLLDLSAMLPMAASGLVLGTGIFLVLRPWVAPQSLALPITVLVNAALSLPFIYRLLVAEARRTEAAFDRLSGTLGLPAGTHLRHIILPRLSRPLGMGAGISAALSMGDLGVIALFAGDSNPTLPLMVQRLSGAYRMDEAAAASLLLVALSFGLFYLCDKGGRHVAP